MKHVLLTIVLLAGSYFFSFSQKEYYKWYFGNQAAMDFVPGAPVNVTTSAMVMTDCSASISDSLGNLLFYSNANQIWNRNNQVMPNGSGINGNISGGQPAVIVRKPGSSNLYYLFTNDGFGGPDGFRYTLVDMNLNGGLGDVVTTQKNVLLIASASEQVIAAKDANGHDAWIIAHPFNSGSFNAYHITSAGINTTPVVSTIGAYRGPVQDDATGQITIDSTYGHIAMAHYYVNEFELYDFDNSTGIISNLLTFTGYSKPWGIEYSPDGSKLYMAGWTTQYVDQFDLSTYTQAAINASVVTLGNVTGPGGPYYTGYMQRAPDGKIYIAVYLDEFLAVINSPNSSGLASNLVDNGYDLGVASSQAGLPDKVVVTPYCDLQVKLGNDTTVCSGQAVNLNAANSGATYLWSNGATSQTISVTAQGLYWVSVINAGCSASDTIQINTTNAITLSLGNDTAYCGSFTRVLSTGVANTVWSTGATAAQITVTSPGVYWAHETTGCGVAADTVVITQNAVPLVHLGNDTSLCNGQTLLLDATNANSTYRWQDNSSNATFNVISAGTYNVTVTNNSGCSASGSIAVNYVALPPNVNIGNDTSYCGSFSRILVTGVANTLWSTGVTASQITVTLPGSYWAVESNGCGSNSDTITIGQNPGPTVNLGNDTTLCAGQSVLLNAANINSTYRWQDNSTNPTFNVTGAGLYSVTVTNSFSCSASDSIRVNYDAQRPDINLGNDTIYCQQFNRVLSTGIANTLWSTNAISSQISVNSPGAYWASATNACGTSSDTIMLEESAAPQITFNSTLSVCPGDTILLQPSTTGTNFLWSTGDTTRLIYITTPGNYNLEVWNNIACPTSKSITVPVGTVPVISLGNDTSLCSNNGFLLSLNAPNAHYVWQDGSLDSFYNVTSSGTYSVTATNNCGSATAQRVVEIYPDECALVIPTAFSPNDDGKNDVFKPITRCPVDKFWIHIYNRWGQLVFESNNINIGWDGNFKGVAQPISTFVYYVEYFNYCKGSMDKRAGNVTLLR